MAGWRRSFETEGTFAMTESNSQPFDAALAVEYGKLVNVAYSMVGDESNLMPPCGPLDSGLEFVAWVQMRDFVFNSTTLRFYGLIVHRVGNPDQYVLAIRGTIASNLEEWVDNLTSVDGVAVPNFGNVGYGFHRIFETMQVIKEGETTPTDEFGNPLTVHKPFEWQVAEVVQSHS